MQAVVSSLYFLIFCFRLCTFIRRPASSYKALNNIVAPFSAYLWFTVIGAMLVLAVCLYLAYSIGLNYGSSERPDLYNASQVIRYVLGIFCQQGTLPQSTKYNFGRLFPEK